MNSLPSPTLPSPPAPRPAVSYGRMLVLALRRFREQQRQAV